MTFNDCQVLSTYTSEKFGVGKVDARHAENPNDSEYDAPYKNQPEQPEQPAKKPQRTRTCCNWAHGMHEQCGPSETKRGDDTPSTDDKVDRLP